MSATAGLLVVNLGLLAQALVPLQEDSGVRDLTCTGDTCTVIKNILLKILGFKICIENVEKVKRLL